MADLYEQPGLDHVAAEWGRQPVKHADRFVWPGRAVLVLPNRTWKYQPESCRDDSGTGEWVLDGLVLVCRGCGLDCT